MYLRFMLCYVKAQFPKGSVHALCWFEQQIMCNLIVKVPVICWYAMHACVVWVRMHKDCRFPVEINNAVPIKVLTCTCMQHVCWSHMPLTGRTKRLHMIQTLTPSNRAQVFI